MCVAFNETTPTVSRNSHTYCPSPRIPFARPDPAPRTKKQHGHTSVLIIFQDQLFSTDQFRRTILESLSRLTSVARSAYVRQQETHTVNGPQRAREVPKRRSSNRTLCSVFLLFFIGSSQKKQVPASTPMMRNSLSVPSEVCDDETLNLVNLRRPRRVLLLLGGCILVFGF